MKTKPTTTTTKTIKPKAGRTTKAVPKPKPIKKPKPPAKTKMELLTYSDSIEEIKLDDFPFTLEDVIGQDKAIHQIQDILFAVKDKEVNSFWGLAPSKGILFEGAPGTGKTMAVRAFVKELGKDVLMYELRYIDIASRWIDAPIEHLKQFFKIIELKSKEKHIVLFIDEIEGMLPNRDGGNLHETSIRRVDVFLEWMDGGLKQLKNITVIGATNYLDGVDKAAIRPGRFDAIITFEEFDAESMIEALKMHLAKFRLEDKLIGNVNWNQIKNKFKHKSISGAATESIVKKILKQKSKEHLSNIKSKYSKYESLNTQDKEATIKNQKHFPNPICTKDFVEGIKDYFLSSQYTTTKPSSYKTAI